MRPASFRGIEFLWREIAIEGGRAAVTHVYPDATDDKGEVTASRDPWVEDPSRLPRVMPCVAVFLGPNEDAAAARFIEALERPGPGTLVHPIYGERQAVCGPYRLVHDQTQGAVNVEVTFHESGSAGLVAEVDTTAAAPSQIDLVAAQVAGYYADVQSAIGFAGAVVTSAITAAESVLTEAESALRLVAAPDLAANVKGRLLGLQTRLASLIATPANLVDAWREVFVGLPTQDAIGVHAALLAATLETEPIKVATQATLRAASLCAAGTAALEADYQADRDARELAARYADAARDGALLAPTPEVAGYLWGLGASISAALDKAAGRLPTVRTITLASPTPLGVLVADLYADPERGANLILARNPTANALIVPAGDVEVVGADFA